MTDARATWPVGRLVLLATAVFVILNQASSLGPFGTFVTLDAALALFLVSLFRGRARWWFLAHPVFVVLSAPAFEIPFDDIGTGYSYTGHFALFLDPDTLQILWPELMRHIFFVNGPFELRTVYSLPIAYLWPPVWLFGPDVTLTTPFVNYLSQGVSTMVYAAVGAVTALMLGGTPRSVLVTVTLMTTVSPTFLEMNSALHRYSPMLLGLTWVWTAYLVMVVPGSGWRRLVAVPLGAAGVLLVILSKSPLVLSLTLFVILERLSAGRLPLVSTGLSSLNRTARWTVLLVGLAMFQVLSPLIAPEKYVTIDSQLGGEYPLLRDLPLVGFALRVVYAQLAPFPLLGFTQWELYGGNVWFLPVHVGSTILATWIVLSCAFRIEAIVAADTATRVTVMFGLGVLASLAFGGIGYLVYIAPALPFLGVALLRRETRVPLRWAVGFVLVFEMVAHAARLVRA